MRRLSLSACVPVIAGLVLLGSAASGQASGGPPASQPHSLAATSTGTISPVTDPLSSGSPNGWVTFPGGAFCKSDITIAVVANNEYQDVFTLANGASVIEVKGKLVLRFTNDANASRTFVADASGETMTIVNADGSGSETATGNNWWAFGPNSRANTGEPPLVISHGPVAITFANNAVTSYSLFGKETNVCKRLHA